MSEWVLISERLPEPYAGEEFRDPIISNDVLILFESGMIEVANYDHEDKKWSLVSHGFGEPECEPTWWMPIPELPEGVGCFQ